MAAQISSTQVTRWAAFNRLQREELEQQHVRDQAVAGLPRHGAMIKRR